MKTVNCDKLSHVTIGHIGKQPNNNYPIFVLRDVQLRYFLHFPAFAGFFLPQEIALGQKAAQMLVLRRLGILLGIGLRKQHRKTQNSARKDELAIEGQHKTRQYH